MDLISALLLVALLGLGTARMAAIVSIDKISDPIRDMIFHWYPPEDNDERGWYYQALRPATELEREQMESWQVPWYQKRWWHPQASEEITLRKPSFLGQLLGCHKCTSVWIAGGNVALYYLWRDACIMLNLVTAISFVSSAVDSKFYK